MSLDQPAYSFDQANPPTPSKTPTSPSPDGTVQTPKFESSFYDPRVTWDTADPACSPSIFRTPKPISFETPKPERTANFQAANPGGQGDHASDVVGSGVPATPNAQFRALAQSPGIGYTPNFGNIVQGRANSPSALDTSASFNSAGSIQTPPPTTTSATKQKARSKKAKGKQPASEALNLGPNRRMSVPLAPRPPENRGNDVSRAEEMHAPQQYPSLDFSPDVLGYNFGGPATAPAYPQQKLFWDTEVNSASNLDFSHDMTNPFDAFAVSSGQTFDSQNIPSDTFLDFTNEDTTPVASFVQSNAQVTQRQTQDENIAAGQGYNGVDPSLLFSSPSRMPEPMPGPSAQSRVLTEESLQPYAYQVQEAKREKSYGGVSKSRKRRKPSVDSPAVTAALETLRVEGGRRPGVRRSMTDSFVPGNSRASSSSRPGSTHGRSSPLKKHRESSRRPSSRPSTRPSVSLSIDEFGRARLVEAADRPVDEDAMDLDSQSASDNSTSSSGSMDADDMDELVMSFAPKMPKLGRFSSSASHSQKSSSTSVYSDGQPMLPELKRRLTASGQQMKSRGTQGAPSLKPLREATLVEEGPDSEAETVMDSEDGELNAQSQIRKVVKNRNASINKQPVRHVHSPHKKQGSTFGAQNNTFLDNLSPTTMTDPDLATPTSGTSSASETIRCVCKNGRETGRMIQCESCHNWLHLQCTGINPQRMPEIYLCLFCTGSTPTVRGGRVRDPSRKYAPQSPSGQKAPRYR